MKTCNKCAKELEANYKGKPFEYGSMIFLSIIQGTLNDQEYIKKQFGKYYKKDGFEMHICYECAIDTFLAKQ